MSEQQAVSVFTVVYDHHTERLFMLDEVAFDDGAPSQREASRQVDVYVALSKRVKVLDSDLKGGRA